MTPGSMCMLLRRQAFTPSLHVCSLLSPSLPHFPCQVAYGAQQLGLPNGLMVPHLGHLATAAVVNTSPPVVDLYILGQREIKQH